MLSKLNIVKGAVSKKDLSPILTHLRIKDGWVTGTNGRLTITTRIEELTGLDILVPADKFIRAINLCKNPEIKITKAGRLSIKEDKVKVFLPLLEETEFPFPEPAGELVPSLGILTHLKKIVQFIGEDASRPWACGILLHNGKAYATNNTLIAETEIEWAGSSVNLPSFLIDELLRLSKQILKIRTDGVTVTLKLEDNIWINSSLLSLEWPNAPKLLEKISFDNIIKVPLELKSDIEKMIPFCSNPKLPKILFTEEGLSTEEGSTQSEINLGKLPDSSWRAEPLLNLLTIPKGEELYTDFSQWPSPCPWKRSDGVRGLIIGLRN